MFVADEAALPGATELTAAWPGLRRVVAMETLRLVENPAPGAPRGVSREVRYHLTSSAAAETDAAAAVRAHWGIERRLHWVLDTGFGEDLARVRGTATVVSARPAPYAARLDGVVVCAKRQGLRSSMALWGWPSTMAWRVAVM